MTKHKLSWLLLLIVLPSPALLLSKGPQRQAQEFSDEAEIGRLRHVAGETLRLSLEGAEFRSEANFMGFRSKEVLFSHRTDSRTYFVQNLTSARGKEKQFYRGSDEELLERLHEVLEGFEIPSNEISRARVLQEQRQGGRIDHATGKISLQERRPGRRWATTSRQVEGLPIFSSRALLVLGKDGAVDFLELHWPTIPPETLAEAHRLAFKARESWRPPPLLGAHVESVEAGVLHSPAIGFVMDFQPVIRVVYAPDEKHFGKKAVRYLDRNGRDVPVPRQFGLLPEEIRGTQKALREPKKP